MEISAPVYAFVISLHVLYSVYPLMSGSELQALLQKRL